MKYIPAVTPALLQAVEIFFNASPYFARAKERK